MKIPFNGNSPELHPAVSPDSGMSDTARRESLRLASFNIQTGIDTSSYRQYITRSWQHILPTDKRNGNLNRIADVLRHFDLVGLQEVDGGGARSNYIIQTEYLAQRGGFHHWHHQINRRIGRIALHSNGLLCRVKPREVHDYKLPGLPDRGLLLARFGDENHSFYICIVHLALGQRARLRQIGFISELIGHLPYVVLMGDLNCEPGTREMQTLISGTHLCDPAVHLDTFPSWRPRRKFDHILVTPGLQVENARVLHFACSDHLPVAMEVVLPEGVSLSQ